jgi:hypothetical protein
VQNAQNQTGRKIARSYLSLGAFLFRGRLSSTTFWMIENGCIHFSVTLPVGFLYQRRSRAPQCSAMNNMQQSDGVIFTVRHQQRHGVQLPRRSLTRWVELASQWLQPIYEAQLREHQAGPSCAPQFGLRMADPSWNAWNVPWSGSCAVADVSR